MRISDWSSDVCSSDLVYATLDNDAFVFALTAPVAIGADTTVWLNTDGKTSTGYQIFGFAGGAEYNVNFAADGTVNLYTGGAGETLVLAGRSEEHTSELQSLMRISYAVFCLKKKTQKKDKSQSLSYCIY